MNQMVNPGISRILPRSLDDADVTAIPMNYVISAGLSPKKQGFFFEDLKAPFALMIIASRENNRSDISSLLVTGMWIEGMYLACQVVKEVPHKDLVERIGDSKIVLSDLLLILKNYQSNSSFANLVKEIEKIKKEYENVTIHVIPGETEMVEIDGMLTFKSNDQQIIDISDETLAKIITAIENTRTMIINL